MTPQVCGPSEGTDSRPNTSDGNKQLSTSTNLREYGDSCQGYNFPVDFFVKWGYGLASVGLV